MLNLVLDRYMARGEEHTKMKIDLSLQIDAKQEEEAQVDGQEEENDIEEEVARTQDKEELIDATAGEIEDDASVAAISLQENNKTREVQSSLLAHTKTHQHINVTFFLTNLSLSVSCFC